MVDTEPAAISLVHPPAPLGLWGSEAQESPGWEWPSFEALKEICSF